MLLLVFFLIIVIPFVVSIKVFPVLFSQIVEFQTFVKTTVVFLMRSQSKSTFHSSMSCWMKYWWDLMQYICGLHWLIWLLIFVIIFCTFCILIFIADIKKLPIYGSNIITIIFNTTPFICVPSGWFINYYNLTLLNS